ncbi:MAG TPA: FKBP-type peptidyl-prolyl cis-trans isomerase [Propionibacteriaceae bacterium]|nr:FKBP-type peptidyl-prolyl cis-trans isomerase [Propionibacteriaceae bacterium]
MGGLVVALLTLLLAACNAGKASSSASPTTTQFVPTASASGSASASASASPSGHASITPSTTLDGITVTGDYGKTPNVKIPAPWGIDKTQSKVIVQGTGDPVAASSMIEVNYWGANGYTGKVFDESFSANKPISYAVSGFIKGFQTGLIGQKVGSRVLIGITGPDGYDASGGNSSIGIEVGDSLVFVVDILAVSATGPSGAPVTPAAGLPTVSGDLKSPVVTIPSTSTPPSTLTVQPLIKGTGKAVTATSTIRVDYAEYAWSTGKLIKKTYGYAPLDGALSTTIPGWQTGLVGQTVGSRVLLVVPPAQAYPSGNPRVDVKPGETMVYVVDILFAYEA